MNQDFKNSQINNILAKCWADASFKRQLLADPATVLKAEGVEIPAGYTVRVLENTGKVVNYVLPPNPNAELSDSELEAVAGGKMSPKQNEQLYGPNVILRNDKYYEYNKGIFAKNGGTPIGH
jgi:hypothetical protein